MNMTNQQLMKIILEESEEISNKIKRLEQLSAQIEQSNQRYLSEFKRIDIKVDRSGVDQSIGELERVAEKTKKAVENTQKRFNVVLYSVVFCVIGLLAFFFTFKYGIEIKSDIKEDYRNELIQNGQYNGQKDAEFLKKFKLWIEKNPKDSNDLFRKVEKIQVN